MPIFRPPTDAFVVWTDLYDNSPESRLLGRIPSGERGRNVYRLIDGTYTENQPATFEEIAVTYFGGHNNSITAEEAVALTAAGYGAYIETS